MVVTTIADITGDNAKHAFGAAGIRARFIKVTASGGTARIGDFANVGAARGMLCPQNVPIEMRVSEADLSDSFDLSAVGAYVPSGTTLTVSFGV